MATDISKKSFNPQKHYSGFVYEQGRVQTDADQTEANNIVDRRARAEMVDTFGRCRVSRQTPDAFRLSAAGLDLLIDTGRIYVDGEQAENSGGGPRQFDPVLAESTGTSAVDFSEQPYFPDASFSDLPNGNYLAYLDVWEREVTSIEDPELIEKAIGIPTTSRQQTVWQVKIHDQALGEGDNCSTEDEDLPGWSELIRPSDGRLSTEAVGVPQLDDPCLLPPVGGYRGENATYCIHIHAVDEAGNASFKWSRHNGSVTTAILATPSLAQLSVASVGRDSVLRFNPGDWVEIIDDHLEFDNHSGIIRQIDTVDDATNTINLTEDLPLGVFPSSGPDGDLQAERHTRLRRWDQSGEVEDTDGNLLVNLDAAGADGLIPVPSAGTSIVLEAGVQVTFDLLNPAGRYRAGDQWVFAARSIDASVELLDFAPPCAIHHHYCRLAILEITNGEVTAIDDCRDPIEDPEDGGGCCTEVVQPGEDIQAAIDALPADGGCVCLKPGLHEISSAIRIQRSNITLCGETRGAVVRRADNTRMVRVENPAGLQIQNIEIKNIEFQFDNAEIDGSSNTSMIEFSFCRNASLENCGLSFARAEPLIGVRINQSAGIAIASNDFSGMMIGVWAIGQSSAVSVSTNRFLTQREDAQTDNRDGGIVAVFLQEVFGACSVVGNRIDGYITGILLNQNALGQNGLPLSGAHGSLIAENEIIRGNLQVDDTENKSFGISVAARDCKIRDNQIIYGSHVYAGIQVTGDDCVVENNYIELTQEELDNQPSIGVLLGVSNIEQQVFVTAGAVIGNHIVGPQNSLIVFRSEGAKIQRNRIETNSGIIQFGLFLWECTAAAVSENRIEGAVFSCAAFLGQLNRLYDNEFLSGASGLTVLQQTAFELSNCRIDDMSQWGIIGVAFLDQVAITENRFTSCGYARTPAISIGISGVFGELVIDSCEVINTGISPDAGTVSQPAWQIFADLILDARVQGNLVTFSDTNVLETNLEDRALLMRGFLEFQVNDNLSIGWSATILDNKFLGVGRSALVELFEQQLSDNFSIRFERVFFSNNFCWHASGPGVVGANVPGATVRLAGRSATVMGNHIKANSNIPSVDFQGMDGTFVGNVTQGGTINFGAFPSPENNFNL